jgi:DNA-directed RNA polymerase specialized sigma24 family protein
MRFTAKDIEVVRNGLNFLSFLERQIIIYRFWENQTIEEIATALELSWSEIDELINEAIEKLRTFCLEQPNFSIGIQLEAA